MRFKTIVSLILIGFIFIGCNEPIVVEHNNNSKKEKEAVDTQQALFYTVFNELVNDCSKAVEFTYIFDNYQKIREDRSDALKFVKNYIFPSELYYDKMITTNGDQISLNLKDSLYYSKFTHFVQYLYGEINSEYQAVNMADNEWSFKAVPDNDNPDQAKFTVHDYSNSFCGKSDGETVEISNILINYTRKHENFKLKISTPEDSVLKSPMISYEKGHRHYPIEGTLIVEYIPIGSISTFNLDYEIEEYMKLTVSFHGDTYTINDSNGYTKEFESKPYTYMRNEY